MFVKCHGEGRRTFIAFHGWAGTHRDFLPLTRHLPEDVKLVTPDLPGNGRSDPPAEWSEKAIVGDLVSVLNEVSMEPVTLIGFCSGAALALLVAERIPEKVLRIVMIDPFAYVPWYFRIFLAKTWGRMAYHVTFATAWGRKITAEILRSQQASSEDFTAAFQDTDHEVTLTWLAFLNNIGRPSRFASLRLNVDILYGEKTFRAVRASVREYCAALPQSRTHCLSGFGHLPLVRGAKQIAEIVFSRER